MSKKPATPWQNRIVAHEEMPLSALSPNPRNWRRHPEAQRKALAGVLGEVGLVQGVIWNRRTGLLVDGHARVEEAARAGMATLPVTVVDLSPEDEAKVLATLDPLAAMAQADAAALDTLLRDVATEDAAVMAMLSNLAEQAGRCRWMRATQRPTPARRLIVSLSCRRSGTPRAGRCGRSGRTGS